MHNLISDLSEEQKNLIHIAPILVSILIAGADNDINENEIKEAIKIIHIKSYSEAKNVKNVFKNIDLQSEEMIDELLRTLPADKALRQKTIIEKLTPLNAIFEEVGNPFAIDYYTSLRELAFYVSHAHTQLLDTGYVNTQEKNLAHLDFLNKPISE